MKTFSGAGPRLAKAARMRRDRGYRGTQYLFRGEITLRVNFQINKVRVPDPPFVVGCHFGERGGTRPSRVGLEDRGRRASRDVNLLGRRPPACEGGADAAGQGREKPLNLFGAQFLGAADERPAIHGRDVGGIS